MAANLLESAKHSAVMQVLESKQVDTFNYSVAKSIQFPGIIGTQKFIVNCSSLAGGSGGWFSSGSAFSVAIPPYGLLRKAFLRFKVTNATDTSNLCGYPGVYAFNRFALATASGNMISQLYPENIVYEATQRSDGAKLLSAMGTNGSSGLVNMLAGGTLTVYAPLLFPQFNDPSTWIDALTLEELVFTFYGRPSSEWYAPGTNATLTLNSCDLVLYYAMLPPEHHNELLSVKHPGGSPYNFISQNTFQESVLIANSSVYQIQMYVPSPVYRTIISVRLVSEISSKKIALFVDPSTITKVKVSDSGNTLLESTGAEMVLENGDNTNYQIVLNWGLVGQLNVDQKRSCSAVSLYQMSNPTVELTFEGSVANRQITVIHQTLNAVSVSASANMRNRQITVLSDK